jgi:hypothetical protein
MQLIHLGTSSGKDGCPSVYATDRGTFVVQGWRLLDAEALAQLEMPDHETAVEIPAALLAFMPRPAP